VRGRQRIDQAQQLRQAKQQLTRFIVCLQVATVGTPFPLFSHPFYVYLPMSGASNKDFI